MGAWGDGFADNDTAADWFADALDGCNIDEAIENTLANDDIEEQVDEIRAAAYLLTVLGSSYIWPGDLDKLDGLIQGAIDVMTAMLEPGTEANDAVRDLWGEADPVFDEVAKELKALKEVKDTG